MTDFPSDAPRVSRWDDLPMSQWVQAYGHLLSSDQATQNLLATIHAALDGHDWAPDTLDAIADAMQSFGFDILDPNEVRSL